MLSAAKHLMATEILLRRARTVNQDTTRPGVLDAGQTEMKQFWLGE
jgi:hypothetical protein